MYSGKFFLLPIAACLFISVRAQDIISDKAQTGSLELVSAKNAAIICTDALDFDLIQRSASWLQQDVEMVTGKKLAITNTIPASAKLIIVIGTIEKSFFIQQLIRDKKLNVDRTRDKWDAYLVQTIANPFKGIASALVITGGNKRGAAYGTLELSKQAGVSPWYWWADVPVKKKSGLYIKNGVVLNDAPRVKYRGIFINDEAPAFSGWTKEKFGGVNHLVYEKMFELILRLKGNYLWPAMWGNAFNDDDTLNPVLADKYGIVMGTSHHEPMLRAQQEWKRYGKGQWDYDSNEVVLKNFWRKGIQNMGAHESIVTVGMRGDGDKPMTQGTATALLERIVKDQRQILEEVTGKPASQTPQLWALYKEVQDYYDKGMRVPDDVTLLLCDDNWGNIRKLPKLNEKPRSGGYGIYYHFDYVGGPRNYKWINTNNIARVWEQMHLAYEHNVRQIWIVNVGDLKPMEFPISFFLDYAWNPGKWNEDNLNEYYTQWAKEQFGVAHAKEIGEVIRDYSQYASRRKPELLDANTYSISNYAEAEIVSGQWKDLVAKAEKIKRLLPAAYSDAYFELVLHPVKAFANLHKLYHAVALNKLHSSLGWQTANEYADSAKRFYITDSLLSIQYNTIANGKWSHMMDQTHIGYTYWQQPPVNKMPAVSYVPTDQVQFLDKIAGVTITNYPKDAKGILLFEEDKCVSVKAIHYTRAVNSSTIRWKPIPGIGREGDGITNFPVTANEQVIGKSTPHLEYEMYVYDTGEAKIQCYFSPTLNFYNDDGLKYAISADDQQPQIISINKDDNNTRTWGEWVSNNIIVKTSLHHFSKPGRHTVKYWMVSPAVVLQKIVVDLGGVKPSYLGPPETRKK